MLKRVVAIGRMRKVCHAIGPVLTGFPHMHTLCSDQRLHSSSSIYRDVLSPLCDGDHNQFVAIPSRRGIQFAAIGDCKFRCSSRSFHRSIRRICSNWKLLCSDKEPVSGFLNPYNSAGELDNASLEDIRLSLHHTEFSRSDIARRFRRKQR